MPGHGGLSRGSHPRNVLHVAMATHVNSAANEAEHWIGLGREGQGSTGQMLLQYKKTSGFKAWLVSI